MSDIKEILHIDHMHKISKSIKFSKSEEFIEANLRFLLRFYDLINFELKYERAYLRARKSENGKPFPSTADIYYPPPNITGVGRLNEKGKPSLYLSMTIDTALIEIGAKDGDIVQISGFIPKDKPITLGLIGEHFKAIRGIGGFLDKEQSKCIADFSAKIERIDRKHALSYLFIDLFFDEILRDPEAKKNDYIHSRILSRLLFEKYPFIDGLMYHSVASFGCVNIALPQQKTDELLGLVNTILVKVNRAYPYGLYDVETIQTPNKITPNGDIIWQNH